MIIRIRPQPNWVSYVVMLLVKNNAVTQKFFSFLDSHRLGTESCHPNSDASAGEPGEITDIRDDLQTRWKPLFGHRPSYRLSQFLRFLLNSPECNPDLICWVDRSRNTFKLVNSAAVARLWGAHKQKPNMNYETMGRAMR